MLKPIVTITILLALFGARLPVDLMQTCSAETVRTSTLSQSNNTQSAVPAAPKVLPASTLAYIRINNMANLREGFADSSLAKMLDDPQMRPFVSDTYQTISEMFEEVASQFGLTLDQLLAMPQGQVALAVMESVPPEDDTANRKPSDQETDEEIRERLQRKQRQSFSFSFVLIVDTKNPSPGSRVSHGTRDMRALVDSLSGLAEKNQFIRRDQTIGRETVNRLVRPKGDGQTIEWFEKDGTFVIGFGPETAAGVLRRLQQINDTSKPSDDDAPRLKVLAQDPNFGMVISRCLGDEATHPQITFYASPYEIVKRIIARSGSSFFIQPIVEDLGLKKLRGVGGSIFRGGDEIESISHVHVVIDPPRDGFFGVLRPEEVTPTPPDWIPSDASSYLTMKGNFAVAFDNLRKVVDRFGSEGTFKRFVEDGFQKRTGISLRDDVIGNITGRFVNMNHYTKGAGGIGAADSINALEVIDVEAAMASLKTVQKTRPPGEMKTETIEGQTVYITKRRSRRNRDQPDQEGCVALVDNWLMVASSRNVLKLAMRTRKSNGALLMDDSDYAFMTAELGGKLNGEKPFWLSFNRDAESYRMLYDLLDNPKTAERLQKQAERNPVFEKATGWLGRRKWPDFDTLTKYFGVSGTFGYDEPGGLHFGWMNLRPPE